MNVEEFVMVTYSQLMLTERANMLGRQDLQYSVKRQ